MPVISAAREINVLLEIKRGADAGADAAFLFLRVNRLNGIRQESSVISKITAIMSFVISTETKTPKIYVLNRARVSAMNCMSRNPEATSINKMILRYQNRLSALAGFVRKALRTAPCIHQSGRK